MKKHIESVIIGAGISGLATGHFLKKRNKEFFIFESNNKVGGVINTQKIKGLICENGPNTILINNDAIIELMDDLDLSREIISPTKYVKKKFFLHNGKIVEFPNSIKSFLNTRLISIKSKFKILQRLFFFSKKKYTTVYNYTSENFGEDFHNNIIEPFLNGIYAGNTKKMSFKHALPKLWKINSLYYGFIDYFLRKNKKKNNNNNPIYFKEGFSTLINKIKNSLNDEIHTNFKVKKVSKIDQKKYLIEFSNNQKITCDNIIFTINPNNIMEILNLKIEGFDEKLYNPIDVIHFAFNKKDYDRKIQGFGLLSKQSERTSFLGILFNSDIFPNVAPSELKLITVLVGGENQSNLCELEKDLICSKVESEIKELLKIKKIVFKKHFRWKYAIPRYNIKNIEFLNSSFNDHLSSYKNIHINGNYLNGVSVSECISKSKQVAKKI